LSEVSMAAPAAQLARTRVRAIADAQYTQKKIEERAETIGVDAPDYEFLELIGRGSYGRVYKRYDLELPSLFSAHAMDNGFWD
jgi:hypothetical protein